MSEFRAKHWPEEETSDDGYKPRPISVDVPDDFGEQNYESMMDNYLSFAPDEANALIEALQDGLRQRADWQYSQKT